MFNWTLPVVVFWALYCHSSHAKELTTATKITTATNATTTPLHNATTTPLLNATTTSPHNAATTPLLNATKTPLLNETTTPPLNATTTPLLNTTTTTPVLNATKTPPLNATTAPPLNATTTTPPLNTTTAPPLNATTTPLLNAKTTPLLNATTTPSLNATTTQLLNATTAEEQQQQQKLPLQQMLNTTTNEASASLLMEEINDVYWASATAYRKFGDDTLSPEILMREKLRPFYRRLKQYDWRNFKDPLLRRQFEVILRGAKYPTLNFKFKKATKTLKSMSQQKYVCQMDDRRKCNQAFVHQIKSILASSDDLDEIKYYWREWRNKMPIEIRQALLYYVGYYQNMSTPELSASGVWYDQYEDANFIDELEELMEQLLPFYREMHAHLRYVLTQKYGADVVSSNGLIPHHLLEQATYQAWKKTTVLRNPFPLEKLPNLQAELDEADYYPFDLVNISARFFGSIGMQNLTEEFMRDHFIEMEPGTGGPDCKSRIFDYAEIELHYCPKVYYKKLLQSHADISQVEYALAKNNLSVGLNQEACPGFGNALGEAVILSVSNPQHLQQRLKLLKEYEYDDFLNVNRLYRMAVHSLLTIPTYFVHEKLWVDMIDGKIGPSNYSCHYWNLMQKYMGVEAPLKTDANAYDMPYKFYEGIIDQFRSTKKLFGEFLGYEIYRALCLITGQYQMGNAYKQLDQCDFAAKRLSGKFIHDMMSLGSSKPWREIIKPLTQDKLTKLNSSAFLEYFGPIQTWLSEDNASRKLHVGWTTVDKCKPGSPRIAQPSVKNITVTAVA